MSNYNETNKKIHIEKFAGSVSKEDGGFTTLINSSLRSIPDGFAAGVYAYLLCLPPNWELHPAQIANHYNCNKAKIYNALLLLRKLGLLTREDIREKGKFVKFHYTVHLRTKCEKSQLDKGFSPVLKKPELVKPELINQDTYKIKNIKNKDNKKTTTTVKTEKSKSSSVLTPEIDKKLLSLRDKYLQADELDRTDNEFLRQCSHHLDNGDKQKYNLVRRLKGLETIIKSGFFETPAGYKENKIVKSTLTPEESALLAKYQHGLRMSELGQSMSLWVTDKEMIEVNKVLDKIKANEQSKPLKLKDILAKGIPG
jgi:hypothetical protein